MKPYMVVCKGQGDERGREADHYLCLTGTSGLVPFWRGWLGFLWFLWFQFAKMRSALPSPQCKQPILQLSQWVWEEVRKEAMPKQSQLPVLLCSPILWPFSPTFASVSSVSVDRKQHGASSILYRYDNDEKTDLTFLFPVTNKLYIATHVSRKNYWFQWRLG